MSYGQGFSAGLGMAFGEKAKSMLEAQLSRYKGLADVYKTVLNNPDIIDPSIKQEALRRMTLLGNVDPNNPASMKAVKGFENMSDIWTAHHTSKTGGDPNARPSLQFQAAASGGPQLPKAPIQQSQPTLLDQAIPPNAVQRSVGMTPGQPISDPESSAKQQLAQMGIDENSANSLAAEVTRLVGPEPPTGGIATPEWKAWFENKQEVWKALIKERIETRRFQRFSGTGAVGAAAVPPNSTLGRLISQRWAMDEALNNPRTPLLPQTLTNGQPGNYFAGGFFGMDGEPINPQGATRGVVPMQTSTTTDVDPFKGITVTNTERRPLRSGGNTGGGGNDLPPAPNHAPTQNLQNTPPTAALGATPELIKRFPGIAVGDEVDTMAYGIANRQLTPDDLRGKAPEVLTKVHSRLIQAGIIPLEEKEFQAAKDLRQSEQLLNQMSVLLDAVIKDPVGSFWSGKDDEYTRLRDSVGSLFARETFKQVGQLAVIEQEWARAGFYKGWTAAVAGVAGEAGFKRWANSARNSVQHIQNIIQRAKAGWIGPRGGDWIAGIGPKAEYMKPIPLFNESPASLPPEKIFTQGPYKGKRGRLRDDGKTYEIIP